MTAARRLDAPARYQRRDHADRDAVLQAFALSTPYRAARDLGLTLARGSSPRSRSVRVLCPWHQEHTGGACALTLRSGRLVAHCHSCHEGGDVLAIVAAIEGLDVARDFGAVLARAGALVGVDVRAERERAPGPETVESRLRRELAEARREVERLEREVRALREETGLVRAQAVAHIDALGDTIAALSDAVLALRARLTAARRAA